MAQSRQTPRVWSDAIRGSEILANWVKLGSSAVVLWLSIGVLLGGAAGALWLVENTTSVDRKLWDPSRPEQPWYGWADRRSSQSGWK